MTNQVTLIDSISSGGAINAGTNLTLNVAAEGAAPLNYIWRKNSLDLNNTGKISGANTSSLTVTNMLRADAGTYSVIISNAHGTTTSSNILITVNDPAILQQPASAAINQNATNIFTVRAGGTPPLAYQWYTVSVVSHSNRYTKITGATTSSYTLSHIATAPTVDYAVTVTNSFGALTSTVAHLSFFIPPAITVQPTGTNRVPVGQKVTLTTTATGGAILGYQWLSNGIPLVDATNKQLILSNLVAASNNFQCVVTNGSSVLATTLATRGWVIVTNIPVKISTNPANYTKIAGNNVTFTVAASGTAPLTYQWKENASNIPDATNSTLTLINLQEIGTNYYSCYITNPAGSTNTPTNTVTKTNGFLIVKADTNKPVITISYPASAARLTNLIKYPKGTAEIAPNFDLIGTVTDDGRITSVIIQRTFPTNEAPITSTGIQPAPGSLAFTNILRFLDGTNTYQIVAQDSAGNTSTNIRSFFFVNTTSSLLVTNVGLGTNGPANSTADMTKYGAATNGASLEIGRNYLIKAVPGHNTVFTNWTTLTNGDQLLVLTNGPLLNFKMSSNLVVLYANFLTNPIMAGGANGKYNGLFSEDTGVRMESAGSIFNLTVNTNRTFSGTLNLQGKSYTLASNFNTSGDITLNVNRLSQLRSNVAVRLHLDWEGVNKQITGTVASTNAEVPWTSPLVLDEVTFTTNNLYSNPARYSLLIPVADTSGTTSPAGPGYASITNNLSGIASFGGKTADGSTLAQTTPLSKDGKMPLSIKLYNTLGLLQGWLTFAPTSVAGDLTWIRPSTNHPSTYTNGFTNNITATGETYTKYTNTGSTVFGQPTNQLQLDLYDTEGYSTNNTGDFLHWNLQLTGSALTILNNGSATNKFTAASINASNGTVSVSYKATGGATKTLSGIISQSATNATGYLIGTNQVGSFNLTPR